MRTWGPSAQYQCSGVWRADESLDTHGAVGESRWGLRQCVFVSVCVFVFCIFVSPSECVFLFAFCVSVLL